MNILKTTLFLLCFPLLLTAQTKQKELEQRKKALLEQIKEMSALRQQQSQQHKTTVQQIEVANEKILARTRLIQINQQQANLLSKEIADNEEQMRTLKKELEYHKSEYAKIIKQSYKSKSAQNRLLFLLSSESFSQAYKRLAYMKQYVNYRKEQVTLIQTKTDKIKSLNDTLIAQRNTKNQVLEEQRQEQATLQTEKKELETLAANIRTVERSYEAQIREKQKQANAIDREIQRLIRLAIIEANKREKERLAALNRAKGNASKTQTSQGGMTTSTPPSASDAEVSFVLTPESRRVADSFEANKGNLIWPVVKGYKSQGFGVYYDPVYPELQHYNNGVTIATEKGAEARCVFEGEVSAIQSIPGSNKVVQVRHGNYITIYYNLTDVYVKKGDKVKAKEALGKIFTDSNGKTEMKFFLYKNTTRLNPEFWIHKM
ncbi:murein hydrolase activator EnvC family protein [Capnocytophaga genosp. AHN8471]|uniref:murein hydrolase activator EnvC family protein n=1 Tax=Capnocytophaga genosp. AHN8471 TaxID=327574 RepID=UPI0019346F29|nr:peptidoglycan DD-metalloendopeptidase family protein [Capnocytophaga genosp. AHN8471]MBM0658660.1 peptidoglycan DD-metalloendopeptidase family protein [Capnocytophaga genosp. AHN8471]